MTCPACLDHELTEVMGLAPGLEETVTLLRCPGCNGAWTPYELERRWSLDGQIADCYAEDTHRGSRQGGSGGTKGRREDKPGMRQAREEWRRRRGLGDPQPLGRPDPDPWAKGCDRLTSSVHSVRLSAEERERLARLKEAYGLTDAEALRRALELADAVENARPKEAA